MYVVAVICLSLSINILQKLQRAELFSELSIPQDTQIKSIILGKYEQCFPDMQDNVILTETAVKSFILFSLIAPPYKS